MQLAFRNAQGCRHDIVLSKNLKQRYGLLLIEVVQQDDTVGLEDMTEITN